MRDPIALINLAVLVVLVGTLAFKIVLFLKHRKLLGQNALSAIVVGYVISDVVDLLATFVFAVNSGIRTLLGYDEEQWNTIDAELGIVLRLMIVSSSLWASLFANRQCKERRAEIEKLCQNVQQFLEDPQQS